MNAMGLMVELFEPFSMTNISSFASSRGRPERADFGSRGRMRSPRTNQKPRPLGRGFCRERCSAGLEYFDVCSLKSLGALLDGELHLLALLEVAVTLTLYGPQIDKNI